MNINKDALEPKQDVYIRALEEAIEVRKFEIDQYEKRMKSYSKSLIVLGGFVLVFFGLNFFNFFNSENNRALFFTLQIATECIGIVVATARLCEVNNFFTYCTWNSHLKEKISESLSSLYPMEQIDIFVDKISEPFHIILSVYVLGLWIAVLALTIWWALSGEFSEMMGIIFSLVVLGFSGFVFGRLFYATEDTIR